MILGQLAAAIIVFLVMYAVSCVKILREYERGVIFRLGRLLERSKGPGIALVFPPIDNIIRVSLRLLVMDVPPQDVITKDNVSVKVNAVVYFRVVEPAKAVVEVEDYLYATSQMAQTTLRSVLGQAELDELLSARDKLSHEIQEILDKSTDPWGIKVASVEIKHVDLPQEMQRAMARQAEAERERRAKIITAEGDYQAAEKLTAAAEKMEKHPMSLVMRYLQTLLDFKSSNTSTVIFPLPIEMIKPLIEKSEKAESQKKDE